MESTITTTNTEQQPTTPTPEATGAQGNEKLFTQADLDRIIGERLARAKRDASTDEREQALNAREARLDCREFLAGKGYPPDLLELLDTGDVKRFKDSVERLIALFPSAPQKTAGSIRVDFGGPMGGSGTAAPSIADAFKPKI